MTKIFDFLSIPTRISFTSYCFVDVPVSQTIIAFEEKNHGTSFALKFEQRDLMVYPLKYLSAALATFKAI